MTHFKNKFNKASVKSSPTENQIMFSGWINWPKKWNSDHILNTLKRSFPSEKADDADILPYFQAAACCEIISLS